MGVAEEGILQVMNHGARLFMRVVSCSEQEEDILNRAGRRKRTLKRDRVGQTLVITLLTRVMPFSGPIEDIFKIATIVQRLQVVFRRSAVASCHSKDKRSLRNARVHVGCSQKYSDDCSRTRDDRSTDGGS